MSLFGVFGTSGSGMSAYQTWLDAVAGNVANINDTSATNQPVYQSESINVAPEAGGSDGLTQGVKVTGVRLGSAQGVLAYEPNDPRADAKGMIRHTDVDLGSQMVQMIEAERAYQANVSTISQARQAYQSALGLGS